MFLSRLLSFGVCQSCLASVVFAQGTPGASSCWTTETSFKHIDLGLYTDVAAFASFQSSMNSKYNTPASTNPVVVYTSSTTFESLTFHATGYYDLAPLTSEGFEIYTTVFETTTCTSLVTPTLPPSPTGSICSPHGDHWHCDPSPTDTATPPAENCTPHGDHWHCPPGVPEPSTPPAQVTTPPAATGTCTPHGDHWHCPPGVPEPTTPPSQPAQPTTTSSVGMCTPHGDHWDCPPGVPEPTTPPSQPAQPTKTSSVGVRTPHGNHWHCPPGVPEPTTPPRQPFQPITTTPGGDCTPHGDRWHCPSSVPEPSTPPSQPTAPPDEECTLHGDHWHCPSGVPEPTTPPLQTDQPTAPPGEGCTHTVTTGTVHQVSPSQVHLHRKLQHPQRFRMETKNVPPTVTTGTALPASRHQLRIRLRPLCIVAAVSPSACHHCPSLCPPSQRPFKLPRLPSQVRQGVQWLLRLSLLREQERSAAVTPDYHWSLSSHFSFCFVPDWLCRLS
ncbi:hypothetical protein V8F20_005977 [Naviculisporaceae sp. PSN 640]